MLKGVLKSESQKATMLDEEYSGMISLIRMIIGQYIVYLNPGHPKLLPVSTVEDEIGLYL